MSADAAQVGLSLAGLFRTSPLARQDMHLMRADIPLQRGRSLHAASVQTSGTMCCQWARLSVIISAMPFMVVGRLFLME